MGESAEKHKMSFFAAFQLPQALESTQRRIPLWKARVLKLTKRLSKIQISAVTPNLDARLISGTPLGQFSPPLARARGKRALGAFQCPQGVYGGGNGPS